MRIMNINKKKVKKKLNKKNMKKKKKVFMVRLIINFNLNKLKSSKEVFILQKFPRLKPGMEYMEVN